MPFFLNREREEGVLDFKGKVVHLQVGEKQILAGPSKKNGRSNKQTADSTLSANLSLYRAKMIPPFV